MISTLAEVFPQSDVQQDLLPLVFVLAADPIANIRINAAKTFNTLIPALEISYVQKEVIPFLMDKLSTDRDRDVIFFGNVALQTAKKKQ